MSANPRPDYVFAVCEGPELTMPAELVLDWNEAIALAEQRTRETGIGYSVNPLKTPDWRGICGNCGQPWRPALQSVYCPDATTV
jgi:hypothetical protein